MAKLIIRLGAQEWTADLTAEVSTIGRSHDCTIPVQHKSLSRRHCEIHRAEGGFVVRDCGSLNGTVVNGRKISADHRLEPGDRIDVGTAHVYFERIAERPARPAPSRAGAAPDEEADEPVVVPLVEAEGHPGSYAAWSRRGLGAGRMAPLAVAGVVLAAAGVAAYAWLSASGPPPDVENLLQDGNPSLEAAVLKGIPPGWSIPIGTQTGVWVAKGSDAKDGRHYLVVEKAPVPEEFIFSCGVEEAAPVRPGASYAATGWIRSQGLKGGAALRCVLRAAPTGAAKQGQPKSPGIPLAQFYSAPVRGSGEWTPATIEFTAPRGAVQATVECVVAGAEGRAHFDALRLAERPGEAHPDGSVAVDLRRFKALLQPGGAFHLYYKQEGERDKPLLANARLFLRTPHGVVDQGFWAGAPAAGAPSRDKASGAVSVLTHVLHPSTLEWVPVKQTLEESEGEFRIGYEVAGGGVRAEDELGIELASPLGEAGATARVETDTGEQAADLADLAASSVRRFLWSSGEVACSVRYPYAVAIAGGRRAGVLRLEQSVGVGRARAEAGDPSTPAGAAAPPAVFGLGLLVTLQRELGSLQNALDQGAAADTQGRLGEALSIYRRIVEAPLAKQNVDLVKDAERRLRDAEAKLRQAQADVRRAINAARLLADPWAVAEAERRLEDLYQRCQGSPFDQDDVDRLRATLDPIRSQVVGDTSRDPSAETLRLAEFHVKRGDAALGRTLLDHLLRHRKATPIAQEAEQLREKLEGTSDGATPQGKGNGGR